MDDTQAASAGLNTALLPVTVAAYSGGVPTNVVLVVQTQERTSTELSAVPRRVIRWTGPRQELRLEPGAYRIEAFAEVQTDPAQGPIDSVRRSWEKSVVLEAGENELLTLTIYWSGGIRGRVSGSLLDDPTVLIEQLNEGEPIDETQLFASTTRNEESAWRMLDILTSGSSSEVKDGRFAELGLPPGRYLIKVGSMSGATYAYRVVDVARQVVDVEIEVQVPTANRLRVTVLGADRKPISGATDFNLVRRRGDEVEIAEGVTISVKDGIHELAFPSEAFGFFDPWNRGLTYTLVAYRDADGEQRAGLVAGQLQVTIAFEPAVSILVRTDGELRVEGQVREPLRGRLLVRAVPVADIASGTRVTAMLNKPVLVQEEDDTRMSNLAPGRYLVTLNLVKRGGLPWSDEIQLDGALVDAQEKETLTVLRIPTLHTVRLVVPDRPEGTEVSLANIGQMDEMNWGPYAVLREELDADGYCTFPEVPIGAYSVTVDGEPGAMRLEVPCGEVSFTPDR